MSFPCLEMTLEMTSQLANSCFILQHQRRGEGVRERAGKKEITLSGRAIQCQAHVAKEISRQAEMEIRLKGQTNYL